MYLLGLCSFTASALSSLKKGGRLFTSSHDRIQSSLSLRSDNHLYATGDFFAMRMRCSMQKSVIFQYCC